MSHNTNAKIVIIGGGVTGLGIAYHLAKLRVSDVLLIERNQLASGTSWHAAGIVGPLRASCNMTQLASYATTLFPRLEEETGQATGYRRTGGYWLARTEERMTELHRIAAMGEITGIHARILSRDELAKTIDYMRTDDLAGAMYVADDAQASPVDLCMAYAKGARAGGIRILENVCCTGIETKNGAVNSVQLSTGENLRCEAVVNCAGAWARHVGAMADVPVPLQAVEHMYVVTEPVENLPDPFPVIRDLDSGIYIKGDAGKLVLGGFEPFAKPWDALGRDGNTPFLELPDDWEQFEPFMTTGLNRMPSLEQAGIQHFMNGPETFTPDSLQLLGQSPFLKGFFVAAGMNSVGMMSSAGIGKAMAEWIISGEAPMDLWEVDIARFDKLSAAKPFLALRMQEAVSDVFDMHWPYKQMKAGRNIRHGALHDCLARAGAVFGVSAGWERPFWYAENEAEKIFSYSVGEQCWWEAAARESLATRDNVALYELSPLGKFDILGSDALALLQKICAADIDIEIGCTVYSQMLNSRGGIEADVTVTRTAETSFRVISGATTRWKDFAWINRHRDSLELRAEVYDATSSEAVIGLMGPSSRALLQKLTDDDLSTRAFPFSASRTMDIGPVQARATRISFVGELGWELYIPNECTIAAYRAIIDEGTDHGLTHAGHLALDCCRIEKGFKHWGHDIGPEVTPLEAGLSFAVAWDKPGGFIGREALQSRLGEGIRQRILNFVIEGDNPLILHDEPIYRNGELVGRSTSGGRGFRTGLTHAMGYVQCERGASKSDVIQGSYEILVAGVRYSMRALDRPSYDPANDRIKS